MPEQMLLLGSGFVCSGAAFGQERRLESGLEIESVVKVLLLVLVRFPEQALADHIEDYLAEILCRVDSPVLQDRERQRAKLVDGVDADAVHEFLRCQMS